MRRSRWTTVALGLVGAMMVTSGCGAATAAVGREGNYKVEVVTWLTGSGEQESLTALVDDFKRQNPSIEFVDASVGGSAGANARSVLGTRLDSNDPPDSYQTHVGQELFGDANAGRLTDLTSVYTSQGWQNKFPKTLLDAMTVNNKIYAVPLAVHRSNLIWFNPKVLAAAGLAGPAKTWTEFIDQLSALKSRGFLPLAVGPAWTQKQLLENVLLGELGADAYAGLWNGKTDWRSTRVLQAMTAYTRALVQSDVRSASGDWQPMLDKVVDGTAAYAVMGDWAYAYLNSVRKLKFKVDYDVTTSPGTAGVFNYMAEAFTLPKGAAHAGAAQQWLLQCGSLEAQNLFGPLAGSIPARADASKMKFTGYLAGAVGDWQDPNTKVVGSLTYGVVASAAVNAKIDSAMDRLSHDNDGDTFAQNMAEILETTK